jgi:hypothetical protein
MEIVVYVIKPNLRLIMFIVIKPICLCGMKINEWNEK